MQESCRDFVSKPERDGIAFREQRAAQIPDEDDDVEGDEFLSVSSGDDAIVFGGEVGYDLQIHDRLTLGVYAGAERSAAFSCSSVIGEDSACVSARETVGAGVRAGMPLARSSLIYAKLGYSRTQFDGRYEASGAVGGTAATEFSGTLDGYNMGAGLEFGISAGFYGKIEYDFTNFGRNRYFVDGRAATPIIVTTERQRAMAGLGFRF